MAYSKMRPAEILTALILGATHSSWAQGSSICTALDSPLDQNSEKITTDWLTSVQKVSAGSTVPDLTASTGRLYIFDSNATDGSRAVYDLPAYVKLPVDTALVGNGESDAKPRLLLEAASTTSRLETTSAGRYLLANLEVRTQTSTQTKQRVFYSKSPEQLELAGVILSADYYPAGTPGATHTFYMLDLDGKSEQANFTSRFNIHDCEFQVPDIQSSNETVYLFAVLLGALSSENDDRARLAYANNRITTRTYSNSLQRVGALSFVGNVELEPGSHCNSVQDRSGNDLLGTTGNTLVQAQVITPVADGTIGFSNQHAWGWKLVQGQAQPVYNTWDYWKNQGMNVQCSETPGGNNGDSDLAVKVAVPIVTLVAFAALVTTGVIVGYKKIPKKSWQDLRETVQRAFLRLHHTRFRNVPVNDEL